MEERFTEAMAQAAYKNQVKMVPNTNPRLAWYEEKGQTQQSVEIGNIWRYSSYLPEDPRTVNFEDNIYSVKIRDRQIPIIEKVNYLVLQRINNNAYYNEKFTQVILKENYDIVLTDSANIEIPFGLNRWTYDGSSGYLSFLDGTPKGFLEPFRVSFYRYIGDSLEDDLILADGSRSMDLGYVPLADQDVVTKKYVDQNLSILQSTVDKILPPEPPSIENLSIELVANPVYQKKYITSNDLYNYVLFFDQEFTLKIPRIYDPGKGLLLFEVSWDNNSFFEVANLNLRDKTSSGIKIDYSGDYYKETLASRGFYDGIEISWTGKKDSLPTAYKKTILIFRFSYQYEDEYKSSKIITIGFEEQRLTQSFIFNRHYTLAVGLDYTSRYISGVNTPVEGTKISVKGLKYRSLRQFKDDQPILKAWDSMGNEFENYPQAVYPIENPESEILGEIEVPKNYYAESYTLTSESYNFLSEKIDEFSETLNFRIDTVSNENNRVVSGIDLPNGNVIDYGGRWDPISSILGSNELQMLNGQYQFPNQDFSINGTGISPVISFDPTFIIKGPDYSTSDKSQTRFVTFLYEIPYSYGVELKIVDPFNVTQNYETKAFNFQSMKIKVAGWTEWLDAQRPYRGIGPVNQLMDGCLVPSRSEEGSIYCTFGPQPVIGKLYIRIGITFQSEQKFKGFEIKTTD